MKFADIDLHHELWYLVLQAPFNDSATALMVSPASSPLASPQLVMPDEPSGIWGPLTCHNSADLDRGLGKGWGDGRPVPEAAACSFGGVEGTKSGEKRNVRGGAPLPGDDPLSGVTDAPLLDRREKMHHGQRERHRFRRHDGRRGRRRQRGQRRRP